MLKRQKETAPFRNKGAYVIYNERNFWEMAEKKNIMTYAGLKKLEDELQDLKVNRRQEVAQKIREAREQGEIGRAHV